jgi:hypothetical protein
MHRIVKNSSLHCNEPTQHCLTQLNNNLERVFFTLDIKNVVLSNPERL